MEFRHLTQTLATAALAAAALTTGVGSAQQRERPAASPAQGNTAVPDARPADLRQVARLLMQYTQELRHSQDERPLAPNAELQAAAGDFARYMAENDKYGHTADGRQPAERVEAAGYQYCIVEENIAYLYNSQGFSTYELAAQLFEGWRNSPEHRRNMLNPHIREIGIGVAQSAKSLRYYAVQEFGRPRSARIEFEIVNPSGVKLTYQVDGHEFTLEPRYSRRHQRCTPPVVEVAQGEPASPIVLKPSQGVRYVLLPQADGTLRVETGQLAPVDARNSSAAQSKP